MDAQSPIPLGVAFCAGCAVSALIFALLGSGGASTSESSLSSTEPIVAELRRLRESVDRLDRQAELGAAAFAVGAPGGPAVEQGTRTPDLTPLLQQLDQTLAGVNRQLADLGGGAGVSGIPHARESKRSADWNELLPLAVAMSRNTEQAKRTVRFLTVPELLQRFGPPDEVWSVAKSNGVMWNYERMGIWDGEEDVVSSMGFRIQDGYVIDAWGEDHATEALLEAEEGH